MPIDISQFKCVPKYGTQFSEKKLYIYFELLMIMEEANDTQKS